MLLLALPGTRTTAQSHPPLWFDHLALDGGISGPFVEAIARDFNGFLWTAGQRGLDRYDGVRVRSFGPTTDGLALRIRALAPDPSVAGALWIGTDGGLTWFDPATEHFTAVDLHDPPAPVATRTLLSDSTGVWIGTAGRGLLRVERPDRRLAAFEPSPTPFRADTVRALLVSPAAPHIFWLGTSDGLARLNLRDRTALLTDEPRPLQGHAVTALAESPGALWAATADGHLHRLDPTSGLPDRSWPTRAGIAALAASEVHPHLLWIGTRGRGLLTLDARTGTLASVDSAVMPEKDVFDLLEDGEGLLWVGTTGGLYRADLHATRFSPQTLPPAAASDRSASIAALYEPPSAPGALWVGTLRDGLYHRPSATGDLHPFTLPDGTLPEPLFALREDPSGTLWLGGADHPALFRFDPAARRTDRYPLTAGRDHIYTLYEPPSTPGTLWVGTGGSGLVAFDSRGRTVLRRVPTPTPHRTGDAPVWALTEAPDDPGTLWIATHGAGLLRLDARTGTLTPAPRSPDCPLPDTLYALAPAPDGPLWVGAAREGLFRYDRRTGACRRVVPDDGLPTDVVALFVDDHRRVWMSTQTRGLARYDPETDTFTRFSTEDGLHSESFFVPARHQSHSGRLLFGGPGGFVAFHPDSLFIDTTPPPVVLTRVLVDGEPYPLVRDDDVYRPLTLRHDQRDLAFEFAALALRAPEKNRYRVQLDGAEDTPRYIGPQTSERYPFLPPGRYTFRVSGTNADGVWNPEGAALAVTIRPPLWRTWYFWTLIAAAVLGLVVAAYQYRIRQLLRLEHTRRRIADDLHDDIGSKIGSVALRLDLAGRNPDLPDAERARLTELSDAARGVVGDLRDAVWFVDAAHDDLPALVARLEQFAQTILRGRPLRFGRPDTLPPVALDMDTRRHLYLLAKEALHNAARHSTGPVEVHVAYDAPRLRITVADAGPGFDPQSDTAGRGLRTMRARADALGGTLAVESAPDAGTTVRLSLDIA